MLIHPRYLGTRVIDPVITSSRDTKRDASAATWVPCSRGRSAAGLNPRRFCSFDPSTAFHTATLVGGLPYRWL